MKMLPDGWEEADLLEHMDLVKSGVREYSGTKKYVSTGSMKTSRILDSVEVEYHHRPSRANMEVQENDILFAKMKDTEKVYLVSRPDDDNLYSTGFAVLRVRNARRVLPEYVFYWVRSPFFQHWKDRECRGATQKAINQSGLKRLKIILPPVQVQEKVVNILEKADQLIDLGNSAYNLIEDYLKSVFLDMFGDPIRNPKRWGLMTLENVCEEIYRYPTFYGLEYVETGVPVARIGNIREDGLLDPDLASYVFVDSDVNDRFPRTVLELDDIVMAVRGDGSAAKRIGIVRTRNLVGANISPNLLLFRADREALNPMYLYQFLVSYGGQRLLQRLVTRTAKKTITAGKIKKILIPIPPKHLQNRFARTAEKVEEMQEQQNKSNVHIGRFFDSLMQKAFSGELI